MSILDAVLIVTAVTSALWWAASRHRRAAVLEAFSFAEGKGFNLCVQWHPEWQAASNPVSMALLTAFGDACRKYSQNR